MPAQIILKGGLNWYTPDNSITCHVQSGSTISEALKNLHVPVSEVSMITLEEKKVTMDYRIKDSDIITVYPIISGG